MPRSPLTLAASATAALPGANVVGARSLGSAQDGRFTAAVAELDDGRRVVVRQAGDDDTGRALLAEARVLQALSAGVRSLLPFRVPELLGETAVADGRAIVVDFIDGYRVDAADVPAGHGVASLLGAAIAAVHDLPVTVIRAEGFPARSADQVRTETSRLVDRAISTGHIPRALQHRWRRALADDALWRFEATVVLDGLDAASFVFADDDEGVPAIIGLLDWQGLSIGDPAVDVRWVAGAPDAADAVHDAYAQASHRAGDPHLLARARLFAELEFAKWLVHGDEVHDEAIVRDAERLLVSLAEATVGSELVRADAQDVDDAIALLERVPPATDPRIDTSMQTDAYDPAALGAYLAEAERSARDPDFDDDDDDSGPIPTLPVDLSEWTAGPILTEPDAARSDTLADVAAPADEGDDREEAARASRAALRRWSES
ncbi:phosphotransferase [Microbacterium sp. 18062]|uniref:phosphotransferase n=1 Tax=Microbacterium sp. 18062 TaxID=2681410 RepID=UPI00135AF880|nr:phosphotransferase [Microbacterium sp. 18062]